MTNTKILQKILSMDESISNTIIKPKQLLLLRKLAYGQKLTENEKRYLRGNLGKKLEFLEEFYEELHDIDELQQLLNIIDSYYITGLCAMRYNGFGWYYIPKVIEIINTRIEGKIRLKNVTLKFYRIKSIGQSDIVVDEQTGIKYATNEQIILDTKYTKNNYTKSVWTNMLNRYWKQFVKNPNKFREYHYKKEDVDHSLFGV
ncbi:MAG: hypothetical protein JSV09_15975 [Thermoplasmata archaeon]|nr:MAG: hypothetical protein JSV09_15975 [Thermoplasmata archaeon]